MRGEVKREVRSGRQNVARQNFVGGLLPNEEVGVHRGLGGRTSLHRVPHCVARI